MELKKHPNYSQVMHWGKLISITGGAQVIIQAVDFQILKQSSKSMKWYDTNKNIITTPAGQDTLDVMARFCLSDKGALVYSEVLDRLGKL